MSVASISNNKKENNKIKIATVNIMGLKLIMTKFSPELSRVSDNENVYGIIEIVITAHTMGISL